MIKLKIYKHSSLKTQIDDDIKRIPEYFASDFVKQYINEEIVYDVETTNKDYRDDTLYKPLEGKYDTVMFIFETGTFPIYGNTEQYSNTLIKCLCSVNPIEDNIDYSWKVFVHELLHAIWFKVMIKSGKSIPNLLDTYYKNSEPFASDGNFAQQLAVLKPFYMKIVTITRTKSTDKETLGELRSFDGQFGCDTLELAWKDNKRNISCIPIGQYKVKKVFSFKFGYVYEVQDIPNRTAIYLHEGNYFFNSLGCILLGSLPKDINNDGQTDIQNSKLIRKAFEKKMEFKDFILIIK